MSRSLFTPFPVVFALACGVSGSSGTGADTAASRAAVPDTAAGGAPPGLSGLTPLATANTPVLGGWREADRIWLVGGSTVQGVQASGHWEGGEGCLDVTPGGALWWVDGQPGGPVVAVGDGGRVVWLRGGTPEAAGPPTEADLYGVEVRPDGGLHVVGATRAGGGEAWRWTSEEGWSSVVTDLDGALFKVQDGFVVGEGWWGTWNPDAAESEPDLTPWDWRGIIVQADQDGCGWLGGRADGAPVLATLCEGQLSVLEGPDAGVALAGLATTPGGTLWAATGDGLALGRSPAGVWVSSPYALAPELHGVVALPDETALFLGGDLSGGSEGVVLGVGVGAAPRPLLDCGGGG